MVYIKLTKQDGGWVYMKSVDTYTVKGIAAWSSDNSSLPCAVIEVSGAACCVFYKNTLATKESDTEIIQAYHKR